MDFKTQICIVSEKCIPNVLPLLDSAFESVERLVLAVSPIMKEANYVEHYKQALKGRDLDFVEWDLPEDSFDSLALMESFEELFKLYGEDACMNVSSGTKLMGIVAYQMANDFKVPVFYVHAKKDRVLWIDKGRDDFDLQDKINFPMYFLANGYRLESMGDVKVSSGSRELCNWLVDNCSKYEWAIGELNKLCSEASKRGRTTIQLDHMNSSELESILGKFMDCGFVNTYDGRTWTFRDEEARDFANGFWLEEYCYLQMAKHKEKLQAYGMSLEVKDFKGQSLENEIDAAFLFNNSIYFVECKTLRFTETKGADIIYKADCLRDELGGMRAKSIILSYRPLKRQHLERAKKYGVEIFDGNKLKKFAEFLNKL